MSPTLLTLPLEILHLVATTLEADYKPGLLSFAATSRSCYAAANKLRFRKLYIRPQHAAHLAADIRHWTDILSRTDAFAYVRQLELDEPVTSGSGSGLGLLQDQEGLSALLEFLPRLFLLEDLVHACRGPFPPELLRVLHECLPACRLHLMSFDLESPSPSTPERSRSQSPELAENAEAPVIDGDKLALATSPSLHTIVVRNAMLRPMTVNEDMALHMAAGLAPNLKRVNILTWNYDRTPVRLAHVAEESGHGEMLRHVLGRDRSQNENGNGNPGASYLEGLSLPSIQLDQFLEWERRVDFSRLRTLRLWSATPAMLARAAECTFASLRTLALSFDSRGPDFEVPAQRLIASLPSLENLYLGYYCESLLPGALDRHGASLQRLFIQPTVTAPEVARVAACCPRLHDLTIAAHFGGSACASAGFCAAIGLVPALKRLSLSADVDRSVTATVKSREEWARRLFEDIAGESGSLSRAQIKFFAENTRYECFRFRGVGEGEKERVRVHRADVWRSSDRFFKTMFC